MVKRRKPGPVGAKKKKKSKAESRILAVTTLQVLKLDEQLTVSNRSSTSKGKKKKKRSTQAQRNDRI